MKKGTFITLLAVGVLSTAVAAVSLTFGSSDDNDRIDALESSGTGPLDGLTFTGMLGPEGKPPDIRDTFVFADGNFVSKECEARCDYPARPYAAKKVRDGWTFESTTRCPYKDATIVWRGKVTDNRIEGVATWTLRRWYWSIERDFGFEAHLQSEMSLAAENG